MRLRYAILLLAAFGFAGCDDAEERGGGAQTGALTEQQSEATQSDSNGSGANNVRDTVFGEPVEVDGVTIVAEKLTVVPSPIPTLSGEPLEPSDRSSRLMVLTVSVRNDGEASTPDPFCRNMHHEDRIAAGSANHTVGADLTSRGFHFTWWDKSVLIKDNAALCQDIQPGATENYKLVYKVFKGSVQKIRGVLLWNGANLGDDPKTYAFAAR
jgi:hypothetical protein